jgi:hypothetical protein
VLVRPYESTSKQYALTATTSILLHSKKHVQHALVPPEPHVLDTLLAGKHALRLEQERVEWSYALRQIQKALGVKEESQKNWQNDTKVS